jgi:sodium-dependent dicarboxylate transporter 2/3/5
MAMGIERSGLARRMALRIVRLSGTKPAGIVAGFMAATASLSMFVSNTATAAMMVPIALGVIDLVEKRCSGEDPAFRNFAVALLLAVAYSASVGGVGTIVGSPPNGILVRFVHQTYGKEVSFARWMMVGIPFVLLFLPVAWLLLTRVLYPCRIPELADSGDSSGEIRRLGPWGAGADRPRDARHGGALIPAAPGRARRLGSSRG